MMHSANNAVFHMQTSP